MLNKIKFNINLNIKNKKAFTLFEIVLALIIFSMFVGIIFTTYINIKKSEGEIGNQQTITREANDFLDRLHDLSLDYTIDYEEYFNRNMAGCDQGITTWTYANEEGYCPQFTEFGNSDTKGQGLYYCSSFAVRYLQSGYMLWSPSPSGGCWAQSTGNQKFGEYGLQFRNTTDEYLNNGNDIFLGEGPLAIMGNTGVQELYLINNDGDHRVFFRRKMITGADLNGDGSLTGINEKLYTIQTLKLKGFDAGSGHDFDMAKWGVYDGFIDTRACDLEAGFICSGATVGDGEYSGYNLPLDIDDGRVDITDPKITVSDWNFEVYPAKDPYLATNESGYLVDPFIKVSLTTNLYGVQSTDEITLQTSIGFKNSYFNFDMEVLEIPVIGETMMCTWDWARRAGGVDLDYGRGISTDSEGNTYVVGHFDGTADFGATSLTSIGGTDIFIAKLDTDGNYVWARRAGGVDLDYGRGISTDSEGNTYVVGYFDGTAYFGNAPNTISIESTGGNDIFVAKLDTDGNYVWVKRAGGGYNDFGYGISTDSEGNTYIVGYFDGTADFGATSLTSIGSIDIFIAKLDTDGNYVWAKRAGGGSYDYGYGISTDSGGNIYIAGNFNITADFGATSLTSIGDTDIFIAKLDTDGNYVWAKRAGGGNIDHGRGISTDSGGNIYIAGDFNGTADFGATSLTSIGSNDIFIAKLDTDGNYVWAKRAGGGSSDYGHGISTDSGGNIYIAGYFAGIADFGTTSLTSIGGYDIFIAKLDTDGNYVWAKRAGGGSSDYGFGTSTDSEGNIYVAGGFNGTADFGTTSLTSTGNNDIFVAKYTSCDGPPSPAVICGDGNIDLPGEECDDNNIDDGDGCDASCQRETQSGSCLPIPDYSIYNIVNTITQTCNLSDGISCTQRLPTLIGSYSETGSTDFCFFECDNGYTWDGSSCNSGSLSSGDFVTIRQTDLPGTSNSTSITIPTYIRETYDYNVDWDNDGIFDVFGITGNITHDFGSAGEYTIRISGDFPQIYFNNGGDRKKILSVKQRGTGQWVSMKNAFNGCSNFGAFGVERATDTPNLGLVLDISRMFTSANSFNQPLNERDTSSVTNMMGIFIDTNFNQPLNERDTSSVTNMGGVFASANSFNQPLNERDTSSVTDMNSMFGNSNSFNQPLNERDTSSVTNMGSMFYNVASFDQNIGMRNISNLGSAVNMFDGSTLSIENYDALLSGWSSISLQNNVDFNAGNSQYCTGLSARNYIDTTYNWSISDGGSAPGC